MASNALEAVAVLVKGAKLGTMVRLGTSATEVAAFQARSPLHP